MTRQNSSDTIRYIRPVSGWFNVDVAGLLQSRDLIQIFVHRDLLAVYKQTILGPLWFILQPVMTTVMFVFVFSSVARVSTEGVPPVLYYFSGLTVWNYFSGCLTRTSNTFISNAGIFGKVYFPRLSVPLATVISGLVSFVVQLVLFALILLYYHAQGAPLKFGPLLLIVTLPILILQVAALGLGFGILVSSLTTRYRDLGQLVTFGIQLWMFATPIAYPVSQVPTALQWVVAINPMTPIVQLFRLTFLGVGVLYPQGIVVSILSTIGILLVGIVLFSRVEKSFLDTV